MTTSDAIEVGLRTPRQPPRQPPLTRRSAKGYSAVVRMRGLIVPP